MDKHVNINYKITNFYNTFFILQVMKTDAFVFLPCIVKLKRKENCKRMFCKNFELMQKSMWLQPRTVEAHERNTSSAKTWPKITRSLDVIEYEMNSYANGYSNKFLYRERIAIWINYPRKKITADGREAMDTSKQTLWSGDTNYRWRWWLLDLIPDSGSRKSKMQTKKPRHTLKKCILMEGTENVI